MCVNNLNTARLPQSKIHNSITGPVICTSTYCASLHREIEGFCIKVGNNEIIKDFASVGAVF